MFANDATFTFSGQNSKEEACTLSKVVVQNITQNWSETLEGPQFSITIEESSQGLESVLAEDKALSFSGANPFCGSTTLNLNLSMGGDVRMSLIDLTGKTLYSTSAKVEAGYYSLQVSLQMPQLYFLSIETPQGNYNAKLINQGVGMGTGVSISKGGIRNMPTKANSGNVYFDGDEMRFTGYTVVDGKEYTAEQKLTISSGMSKKVVFTFDLPEDNFKESHKTSGMYVGITGFNIDVNYFNRNNSSDRYYLLNNTNSSDFTSFIDNLSMKNGTALYFSVDDGIEYLKQCQFPDDISSVSIITFTDGLELGSKTLDELIGWNNPYAKKNDTYVAAVGEKIKNTKICGLPIDAYCVGIMGKDLASNNPEIEALNREEFLNNLKSLSSKEENAKEVQNMDELNKTFKDIAESLYKNNTKVTFTLVFPEPDEGEKQRFTLDKIKEGDDPTTSEIYIEGIFENKSLKNITCKGCKFKGYSEGTTTMTGFINADKYMQIDFEEFTDDKGEVIEWIMNKDELTKRIDLWRWYKDKQWLHNVEFDPGQIPIPEIEKHTAVALLVLDCSNSLEKDDNFSKVQKAAKNFITTLAGSAPESTDPDPETPDPKPATEYYMKHAWGEGSGDVWSWKKMTKVSDDVFTCEGTWGGSGVNINTTASDDNAIWFADTDIQGASSLSLGDGVKFTYTVSKNTVTAEKTSSGGNVTNYYIKHPWGTGADADWKWRTMTQKSADEYVCKGKWGGVGANINTIAGDTGAEWFAEEDIIGSSQLDLGDCVLFTYKVSSSTLTVSLDTGCE